MAERLSDIVTQIQNVRQLEAIVTAMRGIAASRAQKGRSLLAGIEAYTDVVSRAIGHALRLQSADMTAFSDRVLDAAGSDLACAVNLIVGTRGAVIAGERGINPTWSAPMPTHVDAVVGFANRLADALYGYVAAGTIEKVDILFSRSLAGSGIVIDRHSLLPLDFSRFAGPIENEPPLITLPPEILLERLAAEYVFAQLCQAAMHAFEAENEARMLAMASAKTNIDSKLGRLSQQERRLRQEEITSEIIELAPAPRP
jgi:F-type H+-transporting ATPase subunit gamma